MTGFEPWALPKIPDMPVAEQLELSEEEPALAPEGIRVMYAGAEPAGEDEIASLKFVVYNGTSGRVIYGSKGSQWPFPKVRVNGNKPPETYRCGSMMRSYYIEPGASAEFRVGVYEFETVPRRSDRITVGFYMRPDGERFAREVTSEPFALPDSFRRSIEVWNKRQVEE